MRYINRHYLFIYLSIFVFWMICVHSTMTKHRDAIRYSADSCRRPRLSVMSCVSRRLNVKTERRARRSVDSISSSSASTHRMAQRPLGHKTTAAANSSATGDLSSLSWLRHGTVRRRPATLPSTVIDCDRQRRLLHAAHRRQSKSTSYE